MSSLSDLPEDGRPLPREHESLAFGVRPAVPGSISALAVGGGYTVGPRENRTVLFGRNRPEVHVCVGEDDRKVSRRHGIITHRDGDWWVSNSGKLPIRLPKSQWLFPGEQAFPLTAGYTPLFLSGSGNREHLLELYVAGADSTPRRSQHDDPTEQPRTWLLTEEERLVLVALGQRYLRYEVRPQPVGRQQVADLLAAVRPDEGWAHRDAIKRVDRVIAGVRSTLSDAGVAGLRREEVGEPVGNLLNHNLLTALFLSTSLVPKDLELIDDEPT